ncbi:hypothetical protein [Nocardioides sp.]|uniref:hypothetical protein n=1 Tax=Nocardioides sp. TaxID=35761 RepID=UPI00351904AB
MRGAAITRRLVATAVVVVLVVGGAFAALALRGDDDPYAAYCDQVREQRDALGAALAAGPTTGLLRALPSFEKLRADAPRDIRDEWQVVTSRIVELRDALREADVEPSSYDPAKPPSGLTAAQRQAIQAAAVRLGDQETALALAGVQQQARDVCKTPLSL